MDEFSRTPELSIKAESGEVLIGPEVRLKAGQSKAEIEDLLAPWLRGERDMRTDYVWLDLGAMSFGGEPASLSLCFYQGRLKEMSWSLNLPGAPSAGDWPTHEAIDREVSFVRNTLADQIGFDPAREGMNFRWGEVWSSFDQKGFLAANGLRYRS